MIVLDSVTLELPAKSPQMMEETDAEQELGGELVLHRGRTSRVRILDEVSLENSQRD